jgi:hypothetical protein
MDIHKKDGDDIQPPTPEMWENEQKRIRNDPRLTGAVVS